MSVEPPQSPQSSMNSVLDLPEGQRALLFVIARSGECVSFIGYWEQSGEEVLWYAPTEYLEELGGKIEDIQPIGWLELP